MEPGKNSTRLCWLAVGALTLAVEWTFYAQSIAPVRQRQTETHRGVTVLKGQIAEARQVVREAEEAEAQMSRERSELESLRGSLPSGSTMVWFPERMKLHFGRLGFIGVTARLNTVLDDAGLPGCERSYWRVAIPVPQASQDTVKLLSAVAELDARDVFVRVLDFAVQPNPEDPVLQVATINVSVLVPQ